ncbi:permease [Paenibacillus albidus]|uniref:Permease n=1 Tax=Paenibacillus albidus TaxID=2041023 RepID=A0A917FK05_9BACL|nr:ABC transporter permease [Paenibacillus albidus]GGF88358.1 permease [Paenibacillus albidus]
MKIIREYVHAHLKANKRSSFFIFTAIMIAAALLCAVGVLTYSQWLNERELTVKDRGDWHARFGEPVTAERLKYIQFHPQVEEIYLESQSQSLQLPGTKRPYLNLVQLNAGTWENTPYQRTLLEGRLPERDGEIVVSKQFFMENPQYTIGDSVILLKGQRVLNGVQITEEAPRLKGESFQAAGEQAFTITGSINVTSVSVYPCYYAYGFIESSAALPEERFTVSVRLRDISETYEVAAELAEQGGLKPKASGEMEIEYNTGLLDLYGVKAPHGERIFLQLSGYALASVLTTGLVMLLFIILIYNAFTVTAAGQIKQLGILKSIGATPGQIRRVVFYEAMALACVAVPIGLLLGYGGMAILIQGASALLEESSNSRLHAPFSWPILIIAGVASFATVGLSAWVPARKLAKLMPIEAIRNPRGWVQTGKVKGFHWAHRFFGIEGELAYNSFAANRKAYRTTLISLTLFITLIIGFRSFAVIWMTDQTLVLAEKEYTLDISIATIEEPDPAMLSQLSALQGIKKQVVYRGAEHTLSWEKQKISREFAAAGGFKDSYFSDSPDSRMPTNLGQQEGKPQIFLELKGLDKASFADYCRQIGVDAEQFMGAAEPKGIIVNRTGGNISSFIHEYNLPETEYLAIAVGERLSFDERSLVQQQSEGKYTLTVGALTEQYPELDEYHYPFDLVVVLPMEAYESIVQDLDAERALDYQTLSYKMGIDREQLAAARQQAEAILTQYLPDEDWSMLSLLDKEESNSRTIHSIELLVNSFAILLACIGIAGAFSTVAANLSARRREFAILRSTGMSPRGVKRMLCLESLFFGLLPGILALPLLIVVCTFMLHNTRIATWADFMKNVPWSYLFLCYLLVLSSVGLAYRISGLRITRENIVEAIQDEAL